MMPTNKTEGSPDMDLRIEYTESDAGISEVKITALQVQGEIDLAMEFPRIKKLLERDWLKEEEDGEEC